MLILLPPSEGKTAPTSGGAMDLGSLHFTELTATREKVLHALQRLCRHRKRAMHVLGLGPRLGSEVDLNRELTSAHAAAAVDVYTGVLYAALGVPTLTPAQRTRLDGQVAISSALFGLLRPEDRIPAYRLSGDVSLPGLGPLASVWRAEVTAGLAQQDGPVLDLRSGAYQSLGVLPRGEVAVGRVLLERDGRRSVVSHHNKSTKGRAVRALVTTRRHHSTIDDIAHTLSTAGFTCELHPSAKGPATMDIVTHEL